MPPADPHRSCNGAERQPLLVESNGLGRFLGTESRHPSDHTTSIQMSRYGRTMNPVRLGETGHASSVFVILD